MKPASLALAAAALVGCGKSSSPPTGSGSSAPPPVAVDATAAPAAADAAPTVDAAAGARFQPTDADRAYATRSEFAAAWLAAMTVPPAGAPHDPAWPCRMTFDDPIGAPVEEEAMWTFGGPATCVTPPDQELFGCPTGGLVIDHGTRHATARIWAYDAAGQLVAAQISSPSRTRRVLFDWKDGQPVGARLDSDGDGAPDEFARYTRQGDVLTQEIAAGKPEGWKVEARWTYADGHVVRADRGDQHARLRWDGARVVGADYALGADPKVLATKTFDYECAGVR